MKRMLFALLCVACTGTAWGQTSLPNQPVPQPTLTVVGIHPGTQIQPVSHGRILGGQACAPACTPACAPACAQACLATKTICVPEPATKVTVKFNYSSVCEKICFPKCSSFLSPKCDTGCAQGNCASHPFQKKYLIKKACITECPTTKCVPVEVPACEARGILHHRQTSANIGAPVVVESIPVQPLKK